LAVKKADRIISKPIPMGVSKVVMIKLFFFTLTKYSLFIISQSVFIVFSFLLVD